MITKDYLKKFCLDFKERTGKFPNSTDWSVKNGYPCSLSTAKKLFDKSYTNLRLYCGEPQVKRNTNITLEWVKDNCIIDRNQCWNWNKSCNPNGYGQIRLEGKNGYVHRVVYSVFVQEIPENLIVRHKCDNKKCCNPEHLELGTRSENQLDNVIRNSDYKPSSNGQLTKITRELKTLQEKIDYYMSNIDIVENSSCWVSNVLKQQNFGYLTIEFKNKSYSLHRLILANKLNKDYNDINIARHICHNKSCINPSHLEEGTNKDNALDSRATNKQTRLTAEKVIEIRKDLFNQNLSVRGNKSKFDKFWANKFLVSINTISDVRLNKTWKDIII